jgi:hypothetical protein
MDFLLEFSVLFLIIFDKGNMRLSFMPARCAEFGKDKILRIKRAMTIHAPRSLMTLYKYARIIPTNRINHAFLLPERGIMIRNETQLI